jgi:hypothetical protein
LTCSYSLLSTPLALLVRKLSTPPVASACGSSASWMVTGCAPTSSAMRVVAGL